MLAHFPVWREYSSRISSASFPAAVSLLALGHLLSSLPRNSLTSSVPCHPPRRVRKLSPPRCRAARPACPSSVTAQPSTLPESTQRHLSREELVSACR